MHGTMAQHWAVNVHLKDKWRSVKDDDAHILDREDRWFERGLKEVIYVNNSHWTEGMLYNTKRPCNNGKKPQTIRWPPMREHLASVRRKIWVLTTLNLSRTKIRDGQASAARGWGWGEGNRTIDKLWKTAEINNNQWLDAVCVLTHKEWKKMSEEETHMISSRSTTPRTPSKGNNPH